MSRRGGYDLPSSPLTPVVVISDPVIMAEETPTVPAPEEKMEEAPAPSTSVEQADGEDVDAKAKLLMGEGHKHLVLKDVRSAVNAFQEASSLLGKKYGETADQCADAFYYYGMALLDLARMENNVLGNALEGMPEGEDEECEKEDPNIPSAANLDEKEREQLREQVYEAMAEDKSEKQNGEDSKEPKAEEPKDNEMECEKSSEAEETKDKPCDTSSEAETKEKSSEAETKEKSSEAETKEKPCEKSSDAETKKPCEKSSEAETKEKSSEAETKKPCEKSSEAETKEKPCEKSSEAETKEKPCEKSAEPEQTKNSEGNAEAEKSTEAEAKPESTSEAVSKENGTTEATGEEKSKTEEATEKSKTEVEADSTQEPEEKPKGVKDSEAKSEEAGAPEEKAGSDEEEPMEGEEEEECAESDNEETEEKENSEDEVDNLQIAWEMLDLAKVIFKRQQGKEEQLKAAQAHLKLGEVSIESENYTQAVEDFMSCLNIQKEHLEEHDRLLAETHYQLGLANHYNSKHEDAISHFTQSIDVIEKRLVLLSEQLEKAAVETKEETQKEMEELKGLLPDIKEKIEDSKEAQKTAEDTNKALKETLGGTSSSGFPQENGGTSKSTATVEKSSGDSTVPVSNCVSDISHLVRKKRKPEEESPLKEAKKPKSEPVENGSGNGDAVVPTNEQVEKTEEAENQTPMETTTVESTA